MRHNLAIILSVLVTEVLLVLASRYVFDSWYLYIIHSVGLQIGLAMVAASLLALFLGRGFYNALLLAASIALSLHAWLMLGEFAQDAGAGGQPVLKVISFNILGDNMKNSAAIADMLIASDADVLFLQESAPIGPQIPRLKAAYPYRLGCGAGTITCDLSLWSRRPLIDGRVQTISPLYRDRFMAAAIDVDGTMIQLVTAHLAKPYFDETHAVELKKLGDAIHATTGPLVLGGDFNASTLSPDVRKFLRQTGLKSASTEPATWPVRAVRLGVAIDHLFVRPPLSIASIRRLDSNFGSNHFGLVAEFGLQP
jgi:endonuclease/exonuclease/phosphatase (EEP) superfamily protein YafD